jgi:hypothetical protein
MGSSAQWQRVSAWWWQAAGAGCRAQGAGSRDTLAALLGGARTHARACTREGASARALARGLRPQAGHVAELLRTQAQACRSVDLSAPPKVRLRRSPPSKNHAPPRLESGIYKPGSEPRWRYCRAVASVAAAVTVCTRLTASQTQTGLSACQPFDICKSPVLGQPCFRLDCRGKHLSA